MEGWRKQANLGMVWEGFLALLTLRQFPFIGQMPIPALKAQSNIKNTIKPLANKLVQRGVSDVEQGRDLLSILRTSRLYSFNDRSINGIFSPCKCWFREGKAHSR
jgi:hypothetical protein